MQGTSVIIGTRYAWNIDYKGDQVCLELWSQQQNTLISLGTRHAWNAFRSGLDMPGTFEKN